MPIKRPPSAIPSGQKMFTRLVVTGVFALSLVGMAIAFIFYTGSSSDHEALLPSADGQAVFKELKAGKYPPGKIPSPKIEFVKEGDDKSPRPNPVAVTGESEAGATLTDPVDRRLTTAFGKAALAPDTTGKKPSVYERAIEKAAADKVTLAPEFEAQAKALDALAHAPAFDVTPEVREDTYEPTAPTYSVNEHLKREWYEERERAKRSSPAGSRLTLEPFHSETSRIALAGLLKNVAATGSAAVSSADNGPAFAWFDQPETVTAARGRVFTVEGVLWLLRELPLADPVDCGGKKLTKCYQGIVALIRAGLPYERRLVHDCVSFTALELPPELSALALRPDQPAANKDELAKGTVTVKLTGAWFRRIAFREPADNEMVEYVAPKDDGSRSLPKNIERTFDTEAFMPWLVTRSIAKTDAAPRIAAAVREIVNQYAESTEPRPFSEKDRFDEAGYYALLAEVRRNDGLLQTLPKADLTLRMLGTQELRDQYRSGHVGLNGILLDTYFPLMLTPNISGLRSIYRTFVADARVKNEVSTEAQWYVDVIEPPTAFRGSPIISVDGLYYRSQIFTAQHKGQVKTFVYPMVLARSILPERPASAKLEASTVDGATVLWITVGSAAVVICLLVLLSWWDKKNRGKLELLAAGRVGASRLRTPLPGKTNPDAAKHDSPGGDKQ
jgi:hypothetical protein